MQSDAATDEPVMHLTAGATGGDAAPIVEAMSSSDPGTGRRLLLAGRTAFGVELLAAPGPLLRLLGGEPADERAVVVARILGARQLAEAALLWRHGARWAIRLGALVDLIHAGTAAAAAAAANDAGHRRLAAANVATALALAGGSLALARD
jgi:hypothetical protein